MAFALLANANNAVPSAAIAASAVLPATRTVFPHPSQRQGNGQVVLSGGYTGVDDAEIDIEIRPPSGASVRVSQPIFAGAGNGAMSQPIAAPDTESQAVTVTLADLGTATTHAQAVVYGNLLLRAKAPGDSGNAIQLTAKPALTLSAQPIGALSAALTADTQEWTDPRHDFGAAALNPDGSIPPTAPRAVFGRNLARVYRHYKRWDGSQWRYGVSPKLAADHAAGSEVHTVTGDYTVGVSDGVAAESYPNLITLHDLLSALGASALVTVVGVIAQDRKPGGAAAMDLPIRTAALALPAVASDPKRMPGLRNVSVSPDAKTETLSIECVANAPSGAERWAVRSKVVSALTEAVTGIPYTDGPAQFTIPAIPRAPETPLVEGGIAITKRAFPRPADDTIGVPDVCLYRPTLGSSAANKTLRLVWVRRPPAECDCTESKVSGRPNPACLGVELTGEGDAPMATLVADYQSRLILLYQKRRDFIATNTEKTVGGELRSAELDIQLMEQASSLFAQCLADLFADSDTPVTAALDAWDTALAGLDADLLSLAGMGTTAAPTTIAPLKPTTAYEVGDVALIFDMGYARCVGAGTTGAALDGYHIDYGTTAWARVSRAEALATFTNDDINQVPDPVNGFIHDIDTFVKRYQAAMDYVRALAGLVPKADASRTGGVCWRDPGDDFYWEFDEEAYLPVFNNVYYHSVILDADGQPSPTHEFGFGLRIACPERLRLGDSITLRIGAGGDVKIDYPYQIGDRHEIPLIGGGPLVFSGGITGTDTLTWRVESSAQGLLPDYPLTLAELAYDGGGLGFTIQRGRLDFALGDQFRFAVETGGRWRWRKDAGAWSTEAEITDSVALADGLSVAFVSGAAPSFEAGDVYRYSVRQPHRPRNVQSAHGDTWHWPGAMATLTLEWPTDQAVSVLGLLRHGLSAPATVTLALWDATNTLFYSAALTVQPGPLLAVLPATVQARKLAVIITGGEGMSLGWVYAGVPFSTRHQPRITLRRHWAVERGSERNPRGAYLGSGRSGEINWENWLMQEEFDALMALLDACKHDGDAPLVLLPNLEIPKEAALVQTESDALDFSDIFDFQPNPNQDRRFLTLTLPLAPVLT